MSERNIPTKWSPNRMHTLKYDHIMANLVVQVLIYGTWIKVTDKFVPYLGNILAFDIILGHRMKSFDSRRGTVDTPLIHVRQSVKVWGLLWEPPGKCGVVSAGARPSAVKTIEAVPHRFSTYD